MHTNPELNKLFKELKERVRAEGLLDKTPIRGAVEIIIVLALFTLSLYSVEHFHFLITTALFVLTIMRSTFVSHDLIHGQYFERKMNKKISYIFANLIMGISSSWWENKHNILHHTFTNIINKDTDIDMAGGAFIGRKGYGKFFHKHQHTLFWFFLPLIYFSFWYSSIKFNIKKAHYGELFLHGINLLVPLYVISIYGLNDGLLLMAAIYALWSIWFGAVIVTNHLGLEMFDEDEYNDFTWFELQTRTSRNVRGRWLIHWLYGGLNTQVEHHLFPKAPRFHLLKVAKITEDFCQEHGIYYINVAPYKAYCDIYDFLKAHRV